MTFIKWLFKIDEINKSFTTQREVSNSQKKVLESFEFTFFYFYSIRAQFPFIKITQGNSTLPRKAIRSEEPNKIRIAMLKYIIPHEKNLNLKIYDFTSFYLPEGTLNSLSKKKWGICNSSDEFHSLEIISIKDTKSNKWGESNRLFD